MESRGARDRRRRAIQPEPGATLTPGDGGGLVGSPNKDHDIGRPSGRVEDGAEDPDPGAGISGVDLDIGRGEVCRQVDGRGIGGHLSLPPAGGRRDRQGSGSGAFP